MNMIFNTVLQEKQRIEYMLEKYKNQLDVLPKGTISEKKQGENVYYYLKYRENGKVVSKYVSKEKVNDLKSLIEKRKHIEVMIKSLNVELSTAQKMLEVKV